MIFFTVYVTHETFFKGCYIYGRRISQAYCLNNPNHSEVKGYIMPTLFQPKWGLKSDLPEETTPGSIYITTDTQEIFLDTSGGENLP